MSTDEVFYYVIRLCRQELWLELTVSNSQPSYWGRAARVASYPRSRPCRSSASTLAGARSQTTVASHCPNRFQKESVEWLRYSYIMHLSCKATTSFCSLPHRSCALCRLPSFELVLLTQWFHFLQMYLWYVACPYLSSPNFKG